MNIDQELTIIDPVTGADTENALTIQALKAIHPEWTMSELVTQLNHNISWRLLKDLVEVNLKIGELMYPTSDHEKSAQFACDLLYKLKAVVSTHSNRLDNLIVLNRSVAFEAKNFNGNGS